MQLLSILMLACSIFMFYQFGLVDMLVGVVTAHHRYPQEPSEVYVESP